MIINNGAHPFMTYYSRGTAALLAAGNAVIDMTRPPTMRMQDSMSYLSSRAHVVPLMIGAFSLVESSCDVGPLREGTVLTSTLLLAAELLLNGRDVVVICSSLRQRARRLQAVDPPASRAFLTAARLLQRR